MEYQSNERGSQLLNELRKLAAADRNNSPWIKAAMTEMGRETQIVLADLVVLGFALQRFRIDVCVADRRYEVFATTSGRHGLGELDRELNEKLKGPTCRTSQARDTEWRIHDPAIEIGRRLIRLADQIAGKPTDTCAVVEINAIEGEFNALIDRSNHGLFPSLAIVHETTLIPPEPLLFNLSIDLDRGIVRREGYEKHAKLTPNMARVFYELAQNKGLVTADRMEALRSELNFAVTKIAFATALNKANQALSRIRVEIRKRRSGPCRLIDKDEKKVSSPQT